MATDGLTQEIHLCLEMPAALAYGQVRAQPPAVEPAKFTVLGQGYKLGYSPAVQHSVALQTGSLGIAG